MAPWLRLCWNRSQKLLDAWSRILKCESRFHSPAVNVTNILLFAFLCPEPQVVIKSFIAHEWHQWPHSRNTTRKTPPTFLLATLVSRNHKLCWWSQTSNGTGSLFVMKLVSERKVDKQQFVPCFVPISYRLRKGKVDADGSGWVTYPSELFNGDMDRKCLQWRANYATGSR